MSQPLILFVPTRARAPHHYRVGQHTIMPIYLGRGHEPEWVDVPVVIEKVETTGLTVRIDDPDYAAAMRVALTQSISMSMSGEHV